MSKLVCGDYKIVKKLGEGSFGIVYEVSDNKGTHYALKKFIRGNEDGFDTDSLTELDILSRINHPNVTQVYSLFLNKCDPCLVMEKADMDLFEFSEKFHNTLTSEQMRYMLFQMACGLNYLHSNGIVHRDIKTENILIKNDKQFTKLMIADFGMSKIVTNKYQKIKSNGKFTTTQHARAPELWLLSDYDSRVDVWALGILFLELITRQRYFEDEYLDRLTMSVNNVNYRDYIDIAYKQQNLDNYIRSNIMNEDLRHLLINMLSVEPDFRFYSDQVLNHPYFEGLNDCQIGSIKTVGVIDQITKGKYDNVWNQLNTDPSSPEVWEEAMDIYNRYIKHDKYNKLSGGKFDKDTVAFVCYIIAYKLIKYNIKMLQILKHSQEVGIPITPELYRDIECDIIAILDFNIFRPFPV